MHVPSKPFQPSVIFVGEARSRPNSETPERCFKRVCSGLIHKHYTRLKRLARQNTQAYYKYWQFTGAKRITTLGPGANF
jgi:hypothetical protein